ncbi:MAG: 3-deoxy-D-manno-octulosonic acid transferase [Alphaproteobacteria bacterium]
MDYFIYNLVLMVALILGLPLIPFVFLLGDRFSRGLGQRLGFYPGAVTAALSHSRAIWIHAASVGEVEAASRLSDELRRRWPGCKVLLSTFTATGNHRARQIGAADAVVFLPLDQQWIVRWTLSRLQPALLIFLETEIWPNLVREAYRKGIPTLLLSGRLSAKAFKRYARFRFFFRRVLQYYSVLGMQSQDDAERILKLGAERGRVIISGNLKRAPAIRSETAKRNEHLDAGNGAPSKDGHLIVAGSSHRGEEEILVKVFIALKAVFPKLQLVLAPRHPQRFSEVEKLLRAHGLRFERQSQREGRRGFERDVVLLDTVGDLQDFYALGDVAFVGGSLVDAGGHNLLEPARLRKPLLFGPFMGNFKGLAEEMKRSGGGIEVQSSDDLIRELTTLLEDPQKRRVVGEKAYQVAAGDPAVLSRTIALAQRYLQPESRP